MDTKMKYDAVDKFLKDISEKGKSDVVCPSCKKPLIYEENGASYSVRCETENCLTETFRGI